MSILPNASRPRTDRLASTVLEKNGFAGGRCSIFTSPDGKHRFDTGPSRRSSFSPPRLAYPCLASSLARPTTTMSTSSLRTLFDMVSLASFPLFCHHFGSPPPYAHPPAAFLPFSHPNEYAQGLTIYSFASLPHPSPLRGDFQGSRNFSRCGGHQARQVRAELPRRVPG